MLPPDSTASCMPPTSEMSAPAASPYQASANCWALMPAVAAHVSSASPPFATSLSIWDMIWEMAEPPASALMPTEESAAENPRIWLSVMPIWLPEPAILMDISMMAASVVAELFPSPTSVAPSLSISSVAVPAMFMNCESCIEASSTPRFVDTDKSPTTDANLESWLDAMPSCPPSSIM